MGKILLVVLLLGVAIYLLVRVIERRGIAPRGGGGQTAGPRGPLGPDDDPDFLRDLDRRRRRRRPEPPDDDG